MLRDIAGLDPLLAQSIVGRLRGAEPAALAVLVTGSYAKRTASPESDLDLTVVTNHDPNARYWTWFEHRLRRRPLHVSVDAVTLRQWYQQASEPATWSLGFAAVVDGIYLWATPDAVEALGDPPLRRHPSAAPELEDFVEAILKAKRAVRAQDELGLRWFAQGAAELVPGLLRPLNTVPAVADRRVALEAALALEVSPEHYRDDLVVCLGLVQASKSQVAAAVERLAGELLAFLRTHAPDVDPQPDLARYLSDGTLERHTQLDTPA